MKPRLREITIFIVHYYLFIFLILSLDVCFLKTCMYLFILSTKGLDGRQIFHRLFDPTLLPSSSSPNSPTPAYLYQISRFPFCSGNLGFSPLLHVSALPLFPVSLVAFSFLINHLASISTDVGGTPLHTSVYSFCWRGSTPSMLIQREFGHVLNSNNIHLIWTII